MLKKIWLGIVAVVLFIGGLVASFFVGRAGGKTQAGMDSARDRIKQIQRINTRAIDRDRKTQESIDGIIDAAARIEARQLELDRAIAAARTHHDEIGEILGFKDD